ncbi:MAG: hypothetical protein QXG00_05350 [Candidatus Woesearchaeota archaeon]
MVFSKKRVESHVLEKVIVSFMIIFGIAAFLILMSALAIDRPDSSLAVIEMLIIMILALFAQTFVLIKVYEQLNKLQENKK